MLHSCNQVATKETDCRPPSPLSSATAEDPQKLMTTAEKKGQGKLLLHLSNKPQELYHTRNCFTAGHFWQGTGDFWELSNETEEWLNGFPV